MTRLDTHSTAKRRIIDLRPLHIPEVVVLGRHHQMLEIWYLTKGAQAKHLESASGRLALTPQPLGKSPPQRSASCQSDLHDSPRVAEC